MVNMKLLLTHLIIIVISFTPFTGGWTESNEKSLPTKPLNLFGDDFLTPGPLHNFGNWKWFGKEANAIRPRFDIYGEYRLVAVGSRVNNNTQGEISQRVNLEMNLQLTGTERIHARVRPLDEPNRPYIRRFQDDLSLGDNTFQFDFKQDTFWFEGDLGEIFDFIDPDNRHPLDINIAVGYIPLIAHNNYLLNDNLIGVTISKNNLYFSSISNLNLLVFGGIDKIDTFADEDDASLIGSSAFVDWYNFFFEITSAYLHHKHNDNLSQYHFGVSTTKTIGLFGVALRTLLNTGDDEGNGDGYLVVLETNHPFKGNHLVYANFFYGSDGWNPISGGNMGRVGLNFRKDELSSFPYLSNTGIDNIGGALGAKLFLLNSTLTLSPEVSFVIDHSPTDNDQVAIGMETQYKLSNHFLLKNNLIWKHNSQLKNDYGNRIELLFKF